MQLIFLATFVVLLGVVFTHPVEEDPSPAATLDDVAQAYFLRS